MKVFISHKLCTVCYFGLVWFSTWQRCLCQIVIPLYVYTVGNAEYLRTNVSYTPLSLCETFDARHTRAARGIFQQLGSYLGRLKALTMTFKALSYMARWRDRLNPAVAMKQVHMYPTNSTMLAISIHHVFNYILILWKVLYSNWSCINCS